MFIISFILYLQKKTATTEGTWPKGVFILKPFNNPPASFSLINLDFPQLHTA